MRFLHRWIGVTLFLCDDVRILRNDDLRLLYAMVHKIRVSPVKAMVAHWQGDAERIGPIEFTSIITGLANFFCLLNRSVQYISTSRSLITKEYFIQAHMLKEVQITL